MIKQWIRGLVIGLVLIASFAVSVQAADRTVFVDGTTSGTPGTTGAHYATLQAAITGELGAAPNLVTSAAILHIECSGSGADTLSALLAIDGFTTDATHYVHIYTATGSRHAGVFSTSKYRLVMDLVGSTDPLMIISDPYTRIEYMQIQYSSDTAGNKAAIYVNNAGAGETRISNCIIKRGTGANAGMGVWIDTASHTLFFSNNIVYDMTYGGVYTSAASTVYAYNNTFVDNTRGMERDTATFVAKNNIVKGSGSTNAYVGTFSAGTDYNSTDGTDAIGTGTHNQTSKTFTFSNEAGDDFHLSSSDAGAKDLGTDLSADANLPFSNDIDNGARSGSWDIGADEVIVLAYINSSPVITAINATSTAFTATSLSTGSLIVVHVRWSTNFQLTSITDTASNTYAAVAARQTIAGTDYNQLWYAYNTTGNASNVVTLTFGGAVTNIYALTAQYTGIATVTPLNSTTSAVATNTVVTSPSFSTAQASALIVSAAGVAGGSGSSLTPTGTSGTYTSRTTTGPGVSAISDYIASGLQTGVTATYTDNVSDTIGIIVATFNTSAPAAAGTSKMLLLGVGAE